MARRLECPDWVLDDIVQLKQAGVNVYDYDSVIKYASNTENFQLWDWLLLNRPMYTYVVLSRQDE